MHAGSIPESYHITLRFIGDIDAGSPRRSPTNWKGSQVRPFVLTLKGIEVLGGNKPHTLARWSRKSPNSAGCNRSMNASCRCLACRPEPRRFTPHVTLARLKDPGPRRPAALSGQPQPLCQPALRSQPFRAVLVAAVARRRALCGREFLCHGRPHHDGRET